MTLEEVGKIAGKVLATYAKHHHATAVEIAALSGVTNVQAKNACSRLEIMGLLRSPQTYRGPWTITPKGVALVAGRPEPEPQPEPESPPEPEQTLGPVARRYEAEILAEMELQAAMARTKALLTAAPVPARAARTYFKLLEVMPSAIQEALAPITALVHIG